jgi:hypothetical protein
MSQSDQWQLFRGFDDHGSADVMCQWLLREQALDQAARLRGSGLALVIFDLPYLPRLFATPRGEYLKHHLSFMQAKAWVRHDEHYHVDFAMKCHPNAG